MWSVLVLVLILGGSVLVNITDLNASFYTVYVQPILEHASCAWTSYQIRQIKQVKSVTKRLPGHTCIDYKTRLLRLSVDNLEIRRQHRDLDYACNLFFVLLRRVSCSCYSPPLALSSHQFHSKLKTFLFEQSFPP